MQTGTPSTTTIPPDLSRDQERLLNIIDRIVPEGVSESGKVISIYGGGGQGKTTYLARLEPKLRSRLDGPVVLRVNLEAGRLQSPEDILFEIAASLNDEGVSVPLFLGAYYTNLYAVDPRTAHNKYLEDYRAFSDKGAAILRNYLGSIAMIGKLAVDISGMVASSWQTIADALEASQDPITNVSEGTTGQLQEAAWKRLVAAFEGGVAECDIATALASDIEHWALFGGHRAAVVIVDTLERLFWDVANQANRYDAGGASWFEPITRARGSLWIVAGRTEVDWDNLIQFPILFDALSEEASTQYLSGKGVNDPDDVSRIIELSGGVPLYLELCASYVARNGTGSSCDIDGMDRRRLVTHYYRFLDDGVRDALTAAAFLEEWTDENLAMLARNTRATPIDITALHDLSFVDDGGMLAPGTHRLHEIVAEALRSGCSNRAMLESLVSGCRSWMASINNDQNLSADKRRRKRIVVWPVLERLADLDVSLVGGEDGRYQLLMDHADDVRQARAPGKALGLYRAIERRYADSQTIEGVRRRLVARLKQAAIDTDLYLDKSEPRWHEEAIRKERSVVREVWELGLDAGTLANALNSLGISLSRFKLFGASECVVGKALHLAQEAESGIQPENIARYANNLGTVLQGHADYCAGLEDINLAVKIAKEESARLGIAGSAVNLAVDLAEAEALYLRALDTYKLSYRIRSDICDGGRKRVGRTAMLKSLTNLANTRGRLGVLRGETQKLKVARKELKKALRTYKRYYEPTNADYIRCRYARAYLQEQSSRLLSATDKECARRLEKALAWHQEVLEYRTSTMGGAAQGTIRSREHVEACRKMLDDMGMGQA